MQNLTLPYFCMFTEPVDSTSVVVKKDVHYCSTFLAGTGAMALLPIVYNSNNVFGTSLNLQGAQGLINRLVTNLVAETYHGNIKIPIHQASALHSRPPR
jgi:hypothetical protein